MELNGRFHIFVEAFSFELLSYILYIYILRDKEGSISSSFTVDMCA